MKYSLRTLLSILISVLLVPTCFMASCVKSVTDPPVPDSLYVINKLSVFVGGDSLRWNVSTTNFFEYDSVNRQTVQTITEDSYGDPHPYTYKTTYQYDLTNKLSAISFERSGYVYREVHFEYNSDGTLKKGLFTTGNNDVIENIFSVNSNNGNTVITQYDTAASNIGKGEYFSGRPAIVKYTFDNAGMLINKYIVSSELYNGEAAFKDTAETRYVYDNKNRLTKTIVHSIATDNQGKYLPNTDSTQFTNGNSTVTPINDLALAVLRNLHWLSTTDNVNLYTNLYALNAGSIHRNEPLLSCYEDNSLSNYTSIFTNSFDNKGLLVQSTVTTTEHNPFNSGNTTRETRYYSYLKLEK